MSHVLTATDDVTVKTVGVLIATDGTLGAGGGCSANCEIEPDFYCATPGQPCVVVVCGDGVIEPPESCDDGNALPGDGCTAD
jgi:cysteine-rich repeat protein